MTHPVRYATLADIPEEAVSTWKTAAKQLLEDGPIPASRKGASPIPDSLHVDRLALWLANQPERPRLVTLHPPLQDVQGERAAEAFASHLFTDADLRHRPMEGFALQGYVETDARLVDRLLLERATLARGLLEARLSSRALLRSMSRQADAIADAQADHAGAYEGDGDPVEALQKADAEVTHAQGALRAAIHAFEDQAFKAADGSLVPVTVEEDGRPTLRFQVAQSRGGEARVKDLELKEAEAFVALSRELGADMVSAECLGGIAGADANHRLQMRMSWPMSNAAAAESLLVFLEAKDGSTQLKEVPPAAWPNAENAETVIDLGTQVVTVIHPTTDAFGVAALWKMTEAGLEAAEARSPIPAEDGWTQVGQLALAPTGGLAHEVELQEGRGRNEKMSLGGGE